MSNKRVLMSIGDLMRAESKFSDAVELIQPLLESIHVADPSVFFDGLVQFLPEDGDLEDIYYDKDIQCIMNYDILCDITEHSGDSMRNSLKAFYANPTITGMFRTHDLNAVTRVNDYNVLLTFTDKQMPDPTQQQYMYPRRNGKPITTTHLKRLGQ